MLRFIGELFGEWYRFLAVGGDGLSISYLNFRSRCMRNFGEEWYGLIFKEGICGRCVNQSFHTCCELSSRGVEADTVETERKEGNYLHELLLFLFKQCLLRIFKCCLVAGYDFRCYGRVSYLGT